MYVILFVISCLVVALAAANEAVVGTILAGLCALYCLTMAVRGTYQASTARFERRLRHIPRHRLDW